MWFRGTTQSLHLWCWWSCSTIDVRQSHVEKTVATHLAKLPSLSSKENKWKKKVQVQLVQLPDCIVKLGLFDKTKKSRIKRLCVQMLLKASAILFNATPPKAWLLAEWSSWPWCSGQKSNINHKLNRFRLHTNRHKTKLPLCHFHTQAVLHWHYHGGWDHKMLSEMFA